MANHKNPGVAAVLSFVFTGLGQVYNGEIKKGLILMFISAVSLVCVIIGAIITGYCFINVGMFELSSLMLGVALMAVGISVIIIAGIYNIYDAYSRAK